MIDIKARLKMAYRTGRGLSFTKVPVLVQEEERAKELAKEKAKDFQVEAPPAGEQTAQLLFPPPRPHSTGEDAAGEEKGQAGPDAGATKSLLPDVAATSAVA